MPMADGRLSSTIEDRTRRNKVGESDGQEASEMFRKAIFASALSLLVLVGMNARPAAAASMSSSDMSCGLGTGTVHFSLPLDGSARYSIFYYSIDGGAWNTTNGYYSNRGDFWIHYSDGSWASLGSGGGAIPIVPGRGRTVVAWELMYSWSTGRWAWNPLPSCTTTNFVDTYDTYHYVNN